LHVVDEEALTNTAKRWRVYEFLHECGEWKQQQPKYTHLHNFITIHMTFDNRFFARIVCVAIAAEKEHRVERARENKFAKIAVVSLSIFFCQCV
jgi:hypothetical protein